MRLCPTVSRKDAADIRPQNRINHCDGLAIVGNWRKMIAVRALLFTHRQCGRRGKPVKTLGMQWTRRLAWITFDHRPLVHSRGGNLRLDDSSEKGTTDLSTSRPATVARRAGATLASRMER